MYIETGASGQLGQKVVNALLEKVAASVTLGEVHAVPYLFGGADSARPQLSLWPEWHLLKRHQLCSVIPAHAGIHGCACCVLWMDPGLRRGDGIK